tara:strand:+ start:39 stop:785 length:747 start_codon:yes stop_codon:yes gene_type:complete
MELVSIIVPSFNSESFIMDTISSIQNQSYENWELLVTDDCSSDNTVGIIKKYMKKDARIKLFQFKENQGAGVARNNSIKMSIGRYIAFCDSDDQWKSEKLKVQIAFMLENNLALSYTNYDVIDEMGNYKGLVKSPIKATFKKLLNNNYIGCLTAIYDTKKIGKKYMPKMRKRQDWALWLSILKDIKYGMGINNSLAIYRDRSNSISSNKFKLIKYNYILYHEELKFSKIKSFFYVINFMLHYAYKKIK